MSTFVSRKLGILSRAFVQALFPVLGAGVVSTAFVAVPAQAYPDSYKFLDSVKKKEGDKVEQAIMESNGQIVNTKDSSNGDTALHIVVARRDLTWLSYLVSKGADVNAHNDRQVTPLQIAVDLGWNDGVQFLLAHGASIEATNDAGETPLITATHRKNIGIMRMLLDAGANPGRADNSGRTALDYAKLDNDRAVLDLLAKYAKNNTGPAKPVYGPSIP